MKKTEAGDTVTISGINVRGNRVLYDFKVVREDNDNADLERDGKFYAFFPIRKLVTRLKTVVSHNGSRKYLTQAKLHEGLIVRQRMKLDAADPVVEKYFTETAYPESQPAGWDATTTFILFGKTYKEDGSTRTSVANLTAFIEKLGPAIRIEQKEYRTDDPVHLIVFWYRGQEYYYIANGFCTGYMGEGPRGLAEIATLSGFGTSDECQDRAYSIPRNLKHEVLWERLPERFKGIQVEDALA